MKKTFFFLCLAFSITCCCPCFSQLNMTGSSHQSDLEVTYHKTAVLLFPSNIIRVDIGSPDITGRTVKIGDNERILRVKANKAESFTSNLHVFTDDGRVYSFSVRYAPDLHQQTRDMEKEMADAIVPTIAEPKHMLAAQVREYCAAIAHLKPFTCWPRVVNSDMRMRMTGIYIYNGVLFFQFRVNNKGGIPFDLDFTRFYIRDQKTTKRSSVMEKEVLPLFIHYQNGPHIDGGKEQYVVAAFDKFTISNKKLFMAEMFERNGDRHLQCRLKGKHILKARPSMPLKADDSMQVVKPDIPNIPVQ